ncbi:MAG: hypothetical protein ACI4EV_06805 [Lachnospiraceae bacterium]
MRIIRCEIENFGKLSNISLDFDSKIQVFKEENGWGKSTLAAFIRVMFYGFAGETKKNDIDNERRKFRPWQGGTFGGRLVFEANGKTYEIVKKFGTKAREDVVEVYDARTKTITRDFSNNVGEELFGIDMESFARSAFIGQLDCKTTATGSIHAKIGNLTDNTDDINNYDAVRKKLAEMINSMSPARVTGSIHKVSEEINDLKTEVSRASVIDNTIADLKKKVAMTTKERNDLIDGQKKIQEELDKINQSKVLKIKRDNYERICDEYTDLKNQYDDRAAAFNGYVPEQSEIDEQVENARRYNTFVGVANNARLSEEEAAELRELKTFFGDKVPTSDEIAEIKSKAADFDNLKNEMAKDQLTEADKEKVETLGVKFKNGAPSSKTVADIRNKWSESRDKKKNLLIRQGVVEKYKMLIEREKKDYDDEVARVEKNHKMFLIIGGAVAALGIAGFILVNPVALVLVVLGAVVAGVGTMMYKKDKQRLGYGVDTSAQEKQLAEAMKEVSDDEAFIVEMDRRMKEFCNTYGYEMNSSLMDELTELQNELPEYEGLLAKKANYEEKNYEQKLSAAQSLLKERLGEFFTEEELQRLGYYNATLDLDSKLSRKAPLDKKYNEYIALREKVSDYEESLNDFLSKCALTPQSDLEAQIRFLAEQRKEINRIKAQLDGARTRKEDFENDVDITMFSSDIDEYAAKDVEALKADLDESIAKINRIGEDVLDYRKQIDEAVDKKESVAQYMIDLEEKTEEREKLLHKYSVIENTNMMLEKAKENFTAQFMAPIVDSFTKYYNKLSGVDPEKLRVDAGINVTTDAYGEFKSTELLSEGNKDLIGLCMRMALVDAMYQDEKPFVVLDDPFVNLDDDKVKGGIAFLEELSKNYQVIYFTCHESRVL